MPPLHRYLGNPVLSFVGRLFFGIPVRDFHCGLRAFRRAAMLGLGLRTTGMEFASEMIVKASLAKMRYLGGSRRRFRRMGVREPPHLKTWRDGWRHLRFLLLYSPRWLFFTPGVAIFFVRSSGPLALASAACAEGWALDARCRYADLLAWSGDGRGRISRSSR